MAITGNLRTMQLSELLQWLSMGQKTGTLVVRGNPGEKRIYFQGGRILSSSSTIEREYLGHFLVAYGYITDEELTKAMEVQHESKILLGKILVMIGAIKEEDLADLIRLKASETIYDIFLWTEGAFEFIDGELPQMPMIPISVDVTGIVMEGLRRYDEWQRIRTRLKTPHEVPVVVAPIDTAALPERERLILAAMEGTHSIAKIAEATHNPEFFVARFVFELLEAGQAELVGSSAEAMPEPTPDDPNETVFADAAVSPFEAPPAPPPPPRSESLPVERPADRPSMRIERPADRPSVRIERPPERLRAAVPPPAPAPPPDPPPAPAPAAAAPSPAPNVSQFLRRGPDSSANEPRPHVPSRAGDQSGGRLRAVPAAAATAPARPVVAPPPPGSASSTDVRKSSGLSYPDIPLSPSTALIPPNAVPVLKMAMEDLMSWSFTPNEAFIVSRINGHWDVKSIVKISPFPELEVLRVFRKLHEGGVITWE